MNALVVKGNKIVCKRLALAREIIESSPQILKHTLRVYMVGDSPASKIYLGLKKELFLSLNIGFEDIYLSSNTTPDHLINLIKKSNQDKQVGGIVVQLPLLASWSKSEKRKVLNTIDPDKDVDCLTDKSLELVYLNKPKLFPATVKAVLIILESINIDKNCIFKYKVCILGKSDLVGKPLACVLSGMGAEVVCCDEYTKNISEITRKSDIVISATGVPKLLKKEMVKPGSVVIDVGEPKGDVDFENVKKVASYITPVPGGVGPVTVVCLLENFISLF